MTDSATAEVAVIGGGPAGLVAALALAALGARVVLAAPPFDPARAAADGRTTALLPSSVELLINLGAWRHCAEHSAPLQGVRIIDDRGGLMRAPEVVFRAAEVGLVSLGANIANSALTTALTTAASQAPGLTWRATPAVTAIAIEAQGVRLTLAEGGTLVAPLAVAADGRNSIGREAAAIATDAWSYPQAAIATSFRHSRPHQGLSTELHRPAGPLTTVPLPGDASSLVWVEAPAEAARLAALDDAAFLAELEARLQGLLGSLSAVEPRACYPLGGATARRMGQHRIALVGEAAHVIPPIGAQGLNLGLRDAATIAECVADARRRGADIGGPETLAAYHAARFGDVTSRTAAVDLLNRSLLTDLFPVQALRGLGLHALANLAPLRRLAMQAGMAPPGPLPRLMQPAALVPGLDVSARDGQVGRP